MAARSDPGLVIIGRTDAVQPNGWEDAIDRARAYREAGADLVFVDGLKTRQMVELTAEDLAGIPQLVSTWLITAGEARQMGFSIYIHLGVMLRHFADFSETLRELREDGQVTLSPAAAMVEPITEVLRRHGG